MRRIARLAFLAVIPAALVGLYVLAARLQLLGRHLGASVITPARVPEAVLRDRIERDRRAAATADGRPAKEILFGDLHVHTTFSLDAFLWSLPMNTGEGAHPVADACDYARFCSGLDFWSINDHAESSSPERWRETKAAIRQCNAVAGDAANPDLVAFLGYEWSQVGRVPAEHYGHKNVIFRDIEEDRVPTRPIGAAGMATDGLRGRAAGMPWYVPLLDLPNRQRYFDFIHFFDEVRAVPFCPEGVSARDLPDDCYESATTPRDLFRKLDEWGLDAIVIPHGNSWGFYTPAGSTWDKQLAADQDDPRRQFLIEIYSGHGNSEEYRDWKEIAFDAAGKKLVCPPPRPDYLPSCWRAGEIIAARCRKEGAADEECAARAAKARQDYLDGELSGYWAVPGATVADWLDSGQCRDCFLPAFNFRPGGSTQYALAISNFDDPAHPRRFHFGILASSDTHRARPGNGYKELGRLANTEANGARDETWRRRMIPWAYDDEAPRSRPVALDLSRGFGALETERQSSFFLTGGLAAVQAEGRSREAIWDALGRKEVYGTSGDRILLWFDLLNAERADGTAGAAPMGSEARLAAVPRFRVRAVGGFKQAPGCPPANTEAAGAARLEQLCHGECYNPTDERKLITRIEVVRIRPQVRPDEPIPTLIQDPWKRLPCAPAEGGCQVEFDDPEFVAAGRDTTYYVRAIEEPSPAVNGGALRCRQEESGGCLEVKPCYGDYRTSPSDDCLGTVEERAWSSPIFVHPAAP